MPDLPLTVLIPTHGRPTLLKRTLDSLAQCELPDSYHELLVIEIGSGDGAKASGGKLRIVSMCNSSAHK
jgi:glycosyltransferase involved in cell wall biosynthesis